MSEALRMRVNRLPVGTWNRLGMNDSVLEQAVPVREGPMEALYDGKQPSDSREEALREDTALLERLETGMGEDMDLLYEKSHIPFRVFYGKKDVENRASRLRLHFPFENGMRGLNRVGLIAEEGSEMTVTADFTSGRADGGLAGLQIKILAGKRSKVRLFLIQRLGTGFESLLDVGARCGEGARVEISRIILGEGRCWLGGRAVLSGDESGVFIKTGYLLGGESRLDMNDCAVHEGIRTESRIDASGALRERAFKLFRATIDFRSGSSGAVGEEAEDVLLMDDAVVNQTIPLILCGEEDVQGNHGATIGQPDETVLFYMQSRGIPREEAREMLARARVEALCGELPEEALKAQVRQYLDERDGKERPEVCAIREEFPFFRKHGGKEGIVYLDNAATSQKPDCVLRKEREFYEDLNANPYRGLYALSGRATGAVEEAREQVRRFLHAESPEEIIFTRNATEGLNLAAFCLSQAGSGLLCADRPVQEQTVRGRSGQSGAGRPLLAPGDEILVSVLEHHSNLLPWQQAAGRSGAVLKYVECDAEGRLSCEAVRNALTDRTRIAAFTHMSNVFGRTNDLKRFARLAHERGAVVVADGAQSAAHVPVDVRELDVDFFAFSGHKVYGPMGIGVLYGKRAVLEKLPPFLTGGEMIESVSRTGAVYARIPHRFEAGTVNAAGAVGLAEALRFLEGLGWERIERREEELCALAMEELRAIPGVHLLGSPEPAEHHGILTFTVDGVHPHDVAAILDADGIAVRAGHHCAQPLHAHLGISSTARASLSFYNTEEEILRFTESLKTIRRKMGYV